MYYLVQNTEIGKYYYKGINNGEAILTPNKNEAMIFNTKKEANIKLKNFSFLELCVKEIKNV